MRHHLALLLHLLLCSEVVFNTAQLPYNIVPYDILTDARGLPVVTVAADKRTCSEAHTASEIRKAMQAFVAVSATKFSLRPASAISQFTRATVLVPRRQRAPLRMVTVPPDVAEAVTSTSLHLSSSSAALQAGMLLAGPGLNLFNFVMIIRIILTWYPQTNLTKAPWIFIAVPTEPLLRATRKVIQPVGGVDISPIVWFAIMSFVHEILVGPQGLLVLLSQK